MLDDGSGLGGRKQHRGTFAERVLIFWRSIRLV